MAQIRTYIRPLLAWWWLIVAAAVLAAGTSFVYVRMQPDVYQSHATLMVGSAIQDPNPDNSQLQLGSYLARTYADIAMRATVQDAVMQKLGIPELPDYTTRAVPDSQLIELTVLDSDPQRAQAVATELVNQIVQLSPGGQGIADSAAFVNEQLASLQNSIAQTEAEMEKRQAELAKATSARQIVSAEGELSALDAKLGSLRNTYATLLSSTHSGATNAINVLEPPSLPVRPLNSGALQLVALAGIVGALLAMAGVYAIDFLDDSITSMSQLEEGLGLTPLGAIPLLPVLSEGTRTRVLMVADPHTPAAESFRVLRANLHFVSVNKPLQIVQITSPAAGDGKSQIASNLAVAMAQAGKQVVLVDGDLRRPTQHRIFGLVNNAGLTTALIGDTNALFSALQTVSVPGLRVLPSGPLPPNPSELLGSRRMSAILSELKEMCDMIVIDSPPVNAVSDAAILTSQADGVLLVLWAGHTRREQLKNAVTVLQHANAPVLGAVMNGAEGDRYGSLYNVGSGYEQYYSMHSSSHSHGKSSTRGARPAAGGKAAAGVPPQTAVEPKESTAGPRRPPFTRGPSEGGESINPHEYLDR